MNHVDPDDCDTRPAWQRKPGDGRLLSTHLIFPVFALLLLLTTWALVIRVVSVEQEAATRAAIELSRELADTYEAQLVRNLDAIDQTLKAVAFAYVVRGNAALADLQSRDMLPSTIVFDVAIADRLGNVRASTRKGPFENVSNEPYFVAQRAGDSGKFFISQTSVSPHSGVSELVFSRRLADAAGEFAGIVTLAVDPAYFTSGYDAASMGKQGLLGVLGTDGFMRILQVGDNASWSGGMAPLAHIAQSAQTLGTQPWDAGVRRFTNLRVLHGYPLVAIMALSQDEQLAQFRHRRLVYLLETAAGSVLLLTVAAILTLKSRQLAQSRARTRQLQQTYFAASEASLDAFFVWESVISHVGTSARTRTAHGNVVGFVLRDVSRRGVEIAARPRRGLIGAPLETIFPNVAGDRPLEEFACVYETGAFEEREWLYTRWDGSQLWLHRQVVRVDGGVVAIVRDVSARKRAEAWRAEQSKVLEMIAASTPLDDVLARLMHLLESQLTGFAGAILLRDDDGLHVRVGAAPSLPSEFIKAMNGQLIGPAVAFAALAIHARQPVHVANLRDKRYVEAMAEANMQAFTSCRSNPILSHDGDALGALSLFANADTHPADVEAQTIATAIRIAGIAIERRRAEERIRYMANHDALTGLPNRTLLSDRLGQALLQARRYRRSVTVVFADLDNFKLINDSLGHRAGDTLLKTIAQRMVSHARATDTVVRLGGDEFVLVLFDESQDALAVRTIVERLRDTMLEPVDLMGKKYQVSCSMGIASYPADGEDAETLLMNADAAMYRAKALGRNNYQFYTPQMNIEVHERLRWREQLREALARSEFRILYQPQVDARTGSVFGVEALLRWEHPTDGTILPATFIPIAEDTGLIVPLGEWVLRCACEQNKSWQDAGLPPITVSVNVSARQFLHPQWVESVASALNTTGLDPQYLELELTESMIMQNLDGAVETMRKLENMGVKLSIDDFGTGYSSLSALKHFPIARLKIDQSFVRELPNGEDDKAIVNAVISLGQQLNMKVIAEGVETQAQADFLRDNDCHEIQGYLFSHPVRPGEIAAMLASVTSTMCAPLRI
ncbi:EAL domain-containing protein [Trinickia sp. LjRoot230]|uniref:bifunctional diguanylate cyclase/phosphodiesterase n=1 Tax=Trinickia sp. LjRoot230 TaxID=3342288 RepID=UPI003ECD40C4